jgi:hypothetical protein
LREGRTRRPVQLINELKCEGLQGLAQLPRIYLLGTSVNIDRALAADHRLALRRLCDVPPLRVK